MDYDGLWQTTADYDRLWQTKMAISCTSNRIQEFRKTNYLASNQVDNRTYAFHAVLIRYTCC